jgi:hypothetical protein
MKNGGHFAIIGTGVSGWTVDGIIVDTNRDAIDIDSVQNMTVRNSVFNSLTDDAIVLKSSFGLGVFFATQNVLIENCTVSGYDAGSVLDGVYSVQKLVATDLDGPTARVKFGTEGTNGFNTVTIRNVLFDRSRGFALESVDGAELYNVVMTDVVMRNVSSSPIFIRLGDRGRSPVTGISSSESVNAANNVRLDDTGWVLPNLIAKYGNYPATRYIPSYTKNTNSPIGGGTTVSIVNPATPTRLNPNSPFPTDPLSANAVGPGFARVHDISISNVTIENADPRHPILIAGLVGNPIENVSISNVSVQYRGGLKMEHAIEQRQRNTTWTYVAYQSAQANQTLPWLANTFFSKNEALLPRISWDAAANGGLGAWADDPYNVPEMPREYPEPTLFGILPAYGLYARHVKGLTVDNVNVRFMVEDERPAVVLDDVDNAVFQNFSADIKSGVPVFVKVTNTKKRDADREYVLNYPYTDHVGDESDDTGRPRRAGRHRRSSGARHSSRYALHVADGTQRGAALFVCRGQRRLPVAIDGFPAVFRFGRHQDDEGSDAVAVHGQRQVAGGHSAHLFSQQSAERSDLRRDARTLSWTPKYGQAGTYALRFIVNDGVLPESTDVAVTVASRVLGDVNGDESANCADLAMASSAIGTRTGQAGFLPAADTDGNGVIDAVDVKLVRVAVARTPGFGIYTCP